MSRYVQRNANGIIVADYASPQEFETELMEEDHPEFIQWVNGCFFPKANVEIVQIKSEGPTEL
jgi:hypothetical protein